MSFRKQLKATFKDVFGSGGKDKEKEKEKEKKAGADKKDKEKGKSPYGGDSKSTTSFLGGKSASKVSLSLRGRGGDTSTPPPPPPPPPPPVPRIPIFAPTPTPIPIPRSDTGPPPPKYSSHAAPTPPLPPAKTPEPPDDTPYRAWDRALLQLSTHERQDLLHHRPKADDHDEHMIIGGLLRESRTLLVETEKRAWTFTNPLTGATVSLKQKLYSFVSKVETYVKIGDIAVQHSPEITALVWAGVRLIMTVIVSDSETWALVVETMDAVAGLMGRCRIYERLYGMEETEGGKRVMEALVGLYANMLVFSVKTKRYFSKTNRKRMATSAMKPFQLAFGPVMEAMKRWEEKVEKEARAAADEVAFSERVLAQNRGVESMAKMMELKGLLEGLSGTAIPELKSAVKETHSVVQKIRQAQEEEERLRILQWLSQVKYLDNHKTMVKVRQEGTGGWLFERSEWKSWFGRAAVSEEEVEPWWNEPLVNEDGVEVGIAEESPAEGVIDEGAKEEKDIGGLWLHGLPGTGKTILTSLVIDHISKQILPSFPSPPSPSSLLAYFYCSYTETPRKVATAFLATILKQLSISLNPQPENDKAGLGLPNSLVTAYREAKQQGFSTAQLDLKEMEDIIFNEILSSPGLQNVYIVIDALDEMEEKSRKELYPILERLLNHGSTESGASKVKIFAASRAGQRDVKLAFSKDSWSRMGLEKSDTGGDIKKYVEVQTQSAIDGGDLLEGDVDDDLKQEIIDRLVKGAEGMFLWVRYQIANLCEQETEYDVQEALKNLPAGIEETYSNLLSKINAQSPSRKRLAERVLKWMICANRPLTPRELVEAVAIDPTTDSIGIDAKKMAKGVEAIVDVCGNLISYDEQLGVLRFVHFTVREFLEKRFIGAQEAAAGVAEVCLALLCFEGGWKVMGRDDIGSLGKYGNADSKDDGVADSSKDGDDTKAGAFSSRPGLALAEYAILNWGHHSRVALSSAAGSSSNVTLNSLLLDRFLTPDKPYFETWLTAYSHLSDAFRIHIMDSAAEKLRPNQLFAAAHFQLPQEFTVSLVSKTPSLVDPYPGNKWTQFHLAAATSSVHSIPYLSTFFDSNPTLAGEISINTRDSSGQTPLHTIALSRRTSRGGNYIWLSLPDATVVHHLLLHGCDPNITDTRQGDTVFHIACETGNISVLRALCVECIPCPPFPITFPTPPTSKVVKLTTLLERKLNTFGLTPLHALMLSRHIMPQGKREVLMHLLPLSGHDVNARDNFGFSVLEGLIRDKSNEVELIQTIYDVGGVWDLKKPGVVPMGRKPPVLKEWGRGALGGMVFHGVGVGVWRNFAGVGMMAMGGRPVDPRMFVGGKGRFEKGFVERCRRWCEGGWGEGEEGRAY